MWAFARMRIPPRGRRLNTSMTYPQSKGSNESSRGTSIGEVTDIRIVRAGAASRVLRRDGPRGQRSAPWPAADPPARRRGRPCLHQLNDHVADRSRMASVHACTECRTVPQWAQLVESNSRFRRSAFTGIRLRRSLLSARANSAGRDAGEDRSMAREGYSSWTATST